MRKTSTAFRMLLVVASIGIVSWCSAAAITIFSAWVVTSSVRGTAYLDCNRNGIKDNSETGYGGMTVSLSGRSSVGNLVFLTTTTDATGAYTFNGVAQGNYVVNFGFPTGSAALRFSPQNTGSFADATGQTAPLSINGNTDTNGIDVGVIDQTAPKITFNNPNINGYLDGDTVTVECSNLPIMDASWVSVTDNSGLPISATFVDQLQTLGTCNRDGFLKILYCGWVATDACGNSSTVRLYVKIIDSQAPTLAGVPADVTVKTATGEVIPNIPTVTASDNCTAGNIPVSFNQSEQVTACGKTIVRSWSASDDCGNVVTGVQNITVISVLNCLNVQADTFHIGLPGGGISTCLDLGGTGHSIQNIQHCGTKAQQMVITSAGQNCINVIAPTTQSITDTFCAQNCINGTCSSVLLILNSTARVNPCGVISSRSLINITAPSCTSLACYCLADSIDINDLKNNYTITDNNINYQGGYNGCNFDTIYSYSYFTVPNMGGRGPYTLDNWTLNGINHSISSFNTMQQLVDSMNIWDPIGHWQLETAVFSVSGGSTQNTYGRMKITRVANRAYGYMDVNLGTISHGIQMCFNTGNHNVIFQNNVSGCTDTIKVNVACPANTNHITAHDDRITVPKNTQIHFRPLDNDTIVGTLLAVGLVSPPKHGSVGFSGTDSLIYIPNLDYCGNDTLSYRVCNTNFECDTANIFVSVPCNVATNPDAITDVVTTNKNQVVSVNVLSNDILNGTLNGSVTIIKAPTKGSAVVSNNQINYTPQQDACGYNDVLTYQICNANGCDTADVRIAVACVAALNPDAITDVVTTNKNQVVSVNVLSNDILNGTLNGSVTIIKVPTKGTAVVSNNQINYTPQQDVCGYNDVLTYQICNANGCDTADVRVTVACVAALNPDAVTDVVTTNKNQVVSVNVLSNDILNGTLNGSVTIIKVPTKGTAVVSNNQINYTPQQDVCGYNDVLTYQICNANGCDTADVRVTVACVATPNPDAVTDVVTTNKNQVVSVNVLSNDILNGTLNGSVTIIKAPTKGSAVVSNNQINYTPQQDACGYNDVLTYQICNANGCDTADVRITVACQSVLRPIVAVNDYVTTPKNSSVTFRPTLNDTIHNRLLALSTVSAPKNGSISFRGLDSLIYAPNPNFCGLDTFQYRICDTAFNCDVAFVYINVTCNDTVKLLPVAVNDFDSTTTDTPKIIAVLANDTPNGTLSGPLSIITQPNSGSVTVNPNGTVTYTPNLGYCGGNDVFRYRICNNNGCDTADVTVKIKCIPHPPVAVPDVATTRINTPVAITILSNDTINGTLDSIRIITSPVLGTIVLGSDNVITYTPDSCGFTDSFIYRICNKDGCDTALVTIVVPCDPVVPKPVAVYDTARTVAAQPVTIPVTLNDTLQGADTFRITRSPKHGVATFDSLNNIVYLPIPAFCGNDTLIYEICNHNGCDTAYVAVVVACTPPVAVDDDGNTLYNQPVTIPIVLNDNLNGADSIVVITQPKKGDVSILADKSAVYVPKSNYCGPDSFQYVICNRVGCDSAWVRIDVSCGDTLHIYNALSPNQDGKNDGFYIRGIENYPESEVIIFNRWGNQVYYKKGYRNDEAWQGTWQGKSVPDGTYFYIIRLNDPKGQKFSGYLQTMK